MKDEILSKVTIHFEVGKKSRFNNLDAVEDSVHEALCKAIHESDEEALAWLSDEVADITVEV